MKRLLAFALLSLVLPGTALAASPAPTLTLDTAFAPPSGLARDDFTGGSENPYAVATYGGQIYVVGQTTLEDKNTIAILARRSNGTYETGFGNGGKLMLPIAGTETGSARDIAVLPDGRLRIAAVVDVDLTTSTDNDIALIGLLPDGSFDPAFGGGDGVAIFGLPGVNDEPTRIALDATGRIAVAGSSTTSNVEDTLVALRAPDGSATGFGTDGMVKLDLAPATLIDVATDIAFRPGGGVVAIIKRETNPDSGTANTANPTDYIAALRAFNEDGSLASDFGAGGETALTVGEPDTTATALLERRGMFWVTGSTRDGVQTDGFLARVDVSGNGLQFRRFDIRGNLDAAETVQTNPNALALLPGAPETLVAVGNAGYSQGSTFGAAAFNDLDGDVTSMPFGDVVFGSSGGLANALVGAAPNGDRSLAFVGLSIDSSLNSSFITGQLKLDADKVCDLAVDVPAPLEITYRGKTTPTVTLTVENKGKKACAGTITTAAPFALGRAVTTGAVGSGADGDDPRRAGHVLRAPPRRRRRALHGHRSRRGLGPQQQRQERARDLLVLRARARRHPPAGDRAVRRAAARRGQPPQHGHDLLHAGRDACARRQRRRDQQAVHDRARQERLRRGRRRRAQEGEGRSQGHPARDRRIA